MEKEMEKKIEMEMEKGMEKEKENREGERDSRIWNQLVINRYAIVQLYSCPAVL